MAASAISVPVKAGSRVTAFLTSLVGTLAALGLRVVTPHKASLRNLASMPLTVLGFASIDFAAFHLAHGWGWLVTGLSLILLEHLIADDGEAR